MAKSKKKAAAAEHKVAEPDLQHLFKVTCTFRYAVPCPPDEVAITLVMGGDEPQVVDIIPRDGVLWPREIIRNAAGSLGFPCVVEAEPHEASLKEVIQDDEGSVSYVMRAQCTIDFFTTFSDHETRRVADWSDDDGVQPRPRALTAFTKGIEAGMQGHLPIVLIHDETTTEYLGTSAHGRRVDLGEPRMFVMMRPRFYSEED